MCINIVFLDNLSKRVSFSHSDSPNANMEQANIAAKEVRILETAEDIKERLDQVLSRYSQFKAYARSKREKFEDSHRSQYFKRDADELKLWILKLQATSDKGYMDVSLDNTSLILVQFLPQCDEVMFWINDEVCLLIIP